MSNAIDGENTAFNETSKPYFVLGIKVKIVNLFSLDFCVANFFNFP